MLLRLVGCFLLTTLLVACSAGTGAPTATATSTSSTSPSRTASPAPPANLLEATCGAWATADEGAREQLLATVTSGFDVSPDEVESQLNAACRSDSDASISVTAYAIVGQLNTIRPTEAPTPQPTPKPTPKPTPAPPPLPSKRDIANAVESELEYFIDGVQQVKVSRAEIYVEYRDNNWVRDILEANQYKAVDSIAWLFDRGPYPTILIRSNSGIGGGYLQSTTPPSVVKKFVNFSIGETGWHRQATFEVVGTLY